MSTGAENAPLVIDVRTNPYLTAQNRAVLNSVGITGTSDALIWRRPSFRQA
jgi:hypothetical protein